MIVIKYKELPSQTEVNILDTMMVDWKKDIDIHFKNFIAKQGIRLDENVFELEVIE